MFPFSMQDRAILVTIAFICLLIAPARAFGAGNVRDSSGLFGFNARHGDIGTLVASLPMSFLSNAVFGAINYKRVYFGNWLRDYSQLIDVNSLKQVPEPLLRAVVSILGFVQFGFATGEFDVTSERLGVYRPEEHIDNPRGYPSDAQKVDKRLRGPVRPIELQIDQTSGMKNYIANEKIGIATSSAYIRGQLEEAIQKGRQGKNDEQLQWEAMRHLGASLHCLEDFAAHSNYVELCLRLIGIRKSDSALDGVFTYVGEAATVTMAAGPAPPVVTGSFGPLDLCESLLGEVDDRVASGSLSELDVRMGPGSTPIASKLNMLKTVLKGAEALGYKAPPSAYKQLEALESSAAEKGAVKFGWDELKDAPSSLWEEVEPFFEMRDNLAKWIESLGKESIFAKVLGSITGALDSVLYGALGSILGPIIGSFRKQIEEERGILLEKEKAAAKDPESDIFSPGSTATNPTHSQVAKDHFDCVLNIPAAQVAAAITNFTTRSVVGCWDDESLDTEAVIAGILEALHHPFNMSESSGIQTVMFNAVDRWWAFKQPNQRSKLLKLMHKDTIAAGENRFLIERPSEYFNTKGFGDGPKSKPLIQTVKQNLIDARAAGTIEMSNQVLSAAMEKIEAPPTAEQPNPFDAFLALMPSGVGLGTLFSGLAVQDVLAASTMGNVTKDAVVSSLMQKAQDE